MPISQVLQPGLTITGGHIHETAMEVDGPHEVRKAVRYQIKRRVDSIKLMRSGGMATADQDVQAEQFTLEEVQAAVYEAHKAGRMVQPHAIGLQGIMNGVRAGLDSIDHGIFLSEEAAAAASSLIRKCQVSLSMIDYLASTPASWTCNSCLFWHTGADLASRRHACASMYVSRGRTGRQRIGDTEEVQNG